MNFHIVITNNETGESLVNENTNCIIGAIHKDDGGKSMGFSLCSGTTLEIAGAILASREAGLKCCADNPKIALAVLLGDNVEAEEAEKDGAENV
jgi:hypothetical protein